MLGSALGPLREEIRPCAEARRHGFDLPARAEAVAQSRRILREQLVLWGLDEDFRDTACLVMSELFTNAVVHTDGDRVFGELLCGVDRLRISVRDLGLRFDGPRMRAATADGECGRGLLLVDAVSSAWGAHDASPGPGRVVWAELAHGAGGAGWSC
ncbi:ATP-binding protein [Streptomyces sp. NPDC050504]|uniref:ATP-binding protein n=1 Tax=Streptomyces sp. NPDC050504 TaxID=3365618 RepID=UPI003788F61D